MSTTEDNSDAGAGQVERELGAMPPAWRLMGRANPFVPPVLLGHCERLEDACKRAEQWKTRGKFYAVHVRAN